MTGKRNPARERPSLPAAAVLLPEKNVKDLSELPDIVQNELELIQVAHIEDVLDIAFVGDKPKRRRKATGGTPKSKMEFPRIEAPSGQEPIPAQV